MSSVCVCVRVCNCLYVCMYACIRVLPACGVQEEVESRYNIGGF